MSPSLLFRPLSILALLIAVMALAACGGGSPAATAGPGGDAPGDAPEVGGDVGNTAPDPALLLRDDTTVALSDAGAGKPVLLYFFATW